nr:LysE family translocator [Marinicella sp. W31]MDC2875542.1 LysE family translocator [Marinicella sp. W31]
MVWRDVIPFLAAMWIGEVIWLTMALAGFSAVAQTFQIGFHILKWLGVAYLLWLAIRIWRQPAETAVGTLPKRAVPLPMFATGMPLALGNPKIMVYYVALLSALIDVSSVGVRDWSALAAVKFVTLAAINLSWTLMAHKARTFLRTPRAVLLADRFGPVGLCRHSLKRLGGCACPSDLRGLMISRRYTS